MREYLDLHALADGEATDRLTHEVRDLIERDPICAAEYAAIQNLKDFVRGNVRNSHEEEAWKSCVKRLNEIDKTRRAEGFVGRYAWAMCAVAFLAIVGGGILNHAQPTKMDGTDLSSVMASFGPARAPGVSQPDDVKRWVNGLLGRASQTVDPSRMVVRAAAQGAIDGHKVLQLQMRDASGDLVLVVLEGQANFADLKPLPDPRYHGGRMNGMNCISWTKGQVSLVLFGQRSHDELANVANRLSEVPTLQP
jgi:anti-sigma factor RsiW